MSEGHVAIVLAAGGSQRLGRPKQLLTRDGETLVHRAVRLALQTAPSRACVVVGASSKAVADAVSDLPCTIVMNPDWRDGLASSLGVAGDTVAMPHGPVLVLACDQPGLTLAHLDFLLDGASQAASGCAASRHGDTVGIPAVVPGDWFDGATRPRGDTGFGAALRGMPAASLAVLEAPELLLDVDTEADVDEAVARGWLDHDARAGAAAS